MKSLLITITIFFIYLTVSGQKFNKNYFIKSSWFTTNKDSFFYKSDTISFIKYCNKGPEWAKNEFAEYELKYLKTGNYIEIRFGKHRKLDFSEIFNNYIYQVGLNWNWIFNKNKGTLDLFLEGKFYSSFLPIVENEIKVPSKYAEQKELLTTKELKLVRK